MIAGNSSEESRSGFRRVISVIVFLLLSPLVPQAFSQDAEVAATQSLYVAAADGTKLAIDVHLPVSRQPQQKLPAVLVLTRYWRAAENPQTGEPLPALGRLDRFFVENGYAVVKVDVRGSGASYGTRPVEYGPQEVKDGYDIVDWVVRQPWSNGKVGAYGTSYTGTTAELLAASGHPAVKAVIPGWSDFDVYHSPARPYGILSEAMIRKWSDVVGMQDANDVENLRASVRRVDADSDGALLAAAIAEHKANPNVYEGVSTAVFRDQELAAGLPWDRMSTLFWKKEIEQSGVAMLVLVSWLDAGTIEGAIRRFQHFSNPQKVVILASNHGGRFHASPWVVSESPQPPAPSEKEQFELRLAFFDFYLKGEERGVADWPSIKYYNLGEETFKETEVWPPQGTRNQRYFLRPDHALSGQPPEEENGFDEFKVDFSYTTGSANRWMTQMGGPVLGLDNRGVMDGKALIYESSALDSDLQISGTPVVNLEVSSDHSDGAFLVFLEVVDESGRSRYVTEGGLRAIHRKLSKNPYYDQSTPYHSFAKADAMPLELGKMAKVSFELWPISVLVRKGQRLRVAIAGADKDTLERIPSTGTPTIRIGRNSTHTSFIDLPVVTD